MIGFIGTYECKIDAKGRVSIPSALKKQLPNLEAGFVVKRSIFEKCIELYPMQEWEKIAAKLGQLNQFTKKNQQFARMYQAGMKVIEIDDAGRFLLAKDLIEYSQISKDIVLTANLNHIEIWDKNLYEQAIAMTDEDFSDLAEQVMGDFNGDEFRIS
ncbi:division/cell wall cluster transcriptional repressor MraZ [Flavobacterium agricola]|uniref:Transcriptional regulator MraZ n=1 Tax=Flavobacterium agricola TaxID=2870839 RepID=A0ABY6LWS5_9FLAO|nr:division/cell wall cluster transcriptional repressor MraZ [Flavobacterium agricola]UYW00659.1 division/cell wall cluster transcriptional repressor MraZ [Flavobacterium agricola]